MKSYGEISNRYMKQNKKRTALTVFGIALATILIFAVGTFLLSFRDSMIKEVRGSGDYEFKVSGLTSKEAEKLVNNAEVKDSTIYKGSGTYDIKECEKGAELYSADADWFEKIYTSKIVEGREPSAEKELILDYNRKNALKVNVGDKLTFIDKQGKEEIYTLVGVSEASGYSSADYLDMYTYFDSSSLNEDGIYNVSVNLKSAKNKQEIILKVLEDSNITTKNGPDEGNTSGASLSNNSELMYLTGNGGTAAISQSLNAMAIFVIAIIMVATITVIYNSFNISVIERIKYFGILKAIGATPKQIKRIIFKEGFLMGLVALPIGCLIGYLSLKFGIKLFIGNDLMFIKNFEVGFYPSIILFTAVLVAITIYLSVLGPARKANKVSAVDAMRNKNEIKIGKLKRRKGKVVGKIFGVEGSIAYKNLRRTPFRFIITVIALTLSIVIFNVFYGFMDFTRQTVQQQFAYSPFDAQLQKVTMFDEFTNEEINEVENQAFIRDMYKFNTNYFNYAVPVEDINKKDNNYFSDKTLNDLGFQSISSKGFVNDDKGFDVIKGHLVEGKIDLDALKKGGVVLIDGEKTRNEDGSVEIVRSTKYKVGDKIKIPKLKSYNGRSKESYEECRPEKMREVIQAGEFYELPIVAISEKEPIFGQYGGGFELMVHEDAYEKYVGDINANTMYFAFNEDSEARSAAIEYFESKPYTYSDLGDELKQVEDMYKQIEFFVYCFIAIVTIISIVNIFNTISTNLLLRKKEFSTLKAIGMTEKQLKKSVMLEGTIYGILAAIIGGIISAILLGLMVKLGSGMADVKYNFDVIAFTLSIVCAVGVTYISTILPLRKLKKLTIVEGISDEE